MVRSACIFLAKAISLFGFLVLLSTTYFLRGEVLELNRIGFSADQARSEYEQEMQEENRPRESERYQVEVRNYELQMQHYEEMLDLYNTDYDAYAKRLEDEYQPPRLPYRPDPPKSPEYLEQLSDINAEFRARKLHYFEVTRGMNRLAWLAALCLVGGLLTLILFDDTKNRVAYLATLVVSFVFMIGPSFHSILSAIIGFLEAPGIG